MKNCVIQTSGGLGSTMGIMAGAYWFVDSIEASEIMIWAMFVNLPIAWVFIMGAARRRRKVEKAFSDKFQYWFYFLCHFENSVKFLRMFFNL
jgi:hypothetical protein